MKSALQKIILLILAQDVFSAASDSLTIRYEKGLNTDAWQSIFSFKRPDFRYGKIEIRDRLSSSKLLTLPGAAKWKDQHDLSMNLARPLLPRLFWNLESGHLLVKDKQSGFINDIRTFTFGTGLTYQGAAMRVPFFIGPKEDARMDQEDRGWTFRSGLDVPSLRWNDYENRIRGSWEQDYLGKRRNRSADLSYRVHRQFFTDTSDSLRLDVFDRRRDYYINRDGQMESREERGQDIGNILSYHVLPGLRIDVETGLRQRAMKIRMLSGSLQGPKRERRDFHLDGSFKAEWQTRSWSGILRFYRDGEEQTYEMDESQSSSPFSGSSLLVIPDNRSSLTLLSLQSGWAVTPSDSLGLYTSVQKLQYDTPDRENTDDRDEFRFRAELRGMHRFASGLDLRMGLSLHLMHLVYIFGEKSADNNWNRILRLSTSVAWRPRPGLRWSQTADVLANTVVYDYENTQTEVRSFLYRKFQLEDSLHASIGPKLAVFLMSRLEWDENGKLIWDQWLEQKMVDRHSTTLSLLFDYRPWHFLRLGSGYSLYRRRGYQYLANAGGDPLRLPQSDFNSHGPVVQMRYEGRRMKIRLSGSTIATTDLALARQMLTRMDVSMNWMF
jgi:hypothetical protein